MAPVIEPNGNLLGTALGHATRGPGGSAPYSLAGRVAVKSTAFTPNASAEFWVAALRNLKCGTTTDRTRVNPASSKSLNIAPSRRAPPIQLAHSFGSFTIDCDSCFALTMSVMDRRPPGLITRNSSSITLRFRKDRLITPLEITTSADASGNGMFSGDRRHVADIP